MNIALCPRRRCDVRQFAELQCSQNIRGTHSQFDPGMRGVEDSGIGAEAMENFAEEPFAAVKLPQHWRDSAGASRARGWLISADSATPGGFLPKTGEATAGILANCVARRGEAAFHPREWACCRWGHAQDDDLSQDGTRRPFVQTPDAFLMVIPRRRVVAGC